MAERSGADTKPKCTPAELMLKVVLTGTLSHYETRGMIDDKRLEHMLSAGKQILYKTHQESDVRYGLLGLTRLSCREFADSLPAHRQTQPGLVTRHLARLYGRPN